MRNKKGSPRRLGKPATGEGRYPTTGECEFCRLRRNDYICVQPGTGQVLILRSERPYVAATKTVLQGPEAESIVLDLELYWSR